MSYYEKHVFFCQNIKENGKSCCGGAAAEAAARYLRQSLKRTGCHGAGQYRVSTSGCLGRCSEGPCMLVYPKGTWYTYQSESDLDKIMKLVLLEDKSVPELEIPTPQAL